VGAIDEVDPLLFYKPYYLEAGKGGDKAYVLLRDALVDTGKIAIARVVIRARQHLAAVKPQEKGLMLETDALSERRGLSSPARNYLSRRRRSDFVCVSWSRVHCLAALSGRQRRSFVP
jgi:Ku70/Ku80 beta-barrel domain